MGMNLEAELWSLHQELEQTNIRPYITQKQAQALAILMGKCIKGKGKRKKEVRIYALNMIASDALSIVADVSTITSTKHLTGTMAKILLDLFLKDDISWEPSSYARELIGEIEKDFEKNTGTGESSPDSFRVAA
ncbi:MAG: hypothetical protein ACXACG_15995 [Candidatus Thorarchaeota archaeon]|jgi:hypothetical protein